MDTRTVRLSSLPPDLTKEELEKIFSKYGQVERVQVDKENAIVEFKEAAAAAQSFKSLQTYLIERNTRISYAGVEAKHIKKEPSNKLILFILAFIALYFFVFRQWILARKLSKQGATKAIEANPKPPKTSRQKAAAKTLHERVRQSHPTHSSILSQRLDIKSRRSFKSKKQNQYFEQQNRKGESAAKPTK